MASSANSKKYDAVVIGSGLAGLTASLELSQNGARIALVEKTDKLGGNSIKASSGINGAPTRFQQKGDSPALFAEDTFKSGKGLSKPDLVDVLTKNSADAVHWLSDELKVDLSSVARLGGHSFARTHRGSGKLPPGFAIVSALTKKIESSSNIDIFKLSVFKGFVEPSDTSCKGIVIDEDSKTQELLADNIVLATGGFSADFSSSSLIQRYRPDLLELPSTNGPQTTGDGQKIVESQIDGNLIDMDQVQVHPTGFIQLKDESTKDSKWKFLCGELLRGIGGVLLSPKTGGRFVDELTTRDNVTKGVFDNCLVGKNAVSILALSKEDYLKAPSHVDFYVFQNLMFKGTAEELVEKLKLVVETDISAADIKHGLAAYNDVVATGQDPHHRHDFGNKFDDEFYFGFVTPVLHFSMGGIAINNQGQIVTKKGNTMENVFAIGEVSGGLHGANRLGGSSLLECVVFGRHVAKHISSSLKK